MCKSNMEKQNGEISEEESSDPPVNVVLTLENSLIPVEKLTCAPSLADGLDHELEKELRIYSCELIQTAGILLRLPQVAMATGQVLFQRFYYSKSFVRHSFDTTAMGCLCLASKIEEAPRRIRDVINVFHHIRQVQGQKRIEPLMLDQNYISLKTQVIKAERRVLKELGFCVHVKHPHKLITTYLQLLNLEKKRALLQIAWNYMNDSLRTNAFIEYTPETIACACIFLSARKMRITMPNNPNFFELFKIPESDILNISKKIMELYRIPKVSIEELEDHVNDLKAHFEDDRERKRLAKLTEITEHNNSAANGNGGGHGSGSSRSGSAPENNRHHGKRSRTRSRSQSKSRSHTRSDSSESPRRKRSRKHRNYYRSPDRRIRKVHKNRRSSYTPSPPIRDSYKKLKLKRRRDFRNYEYDSEEESRQSTYYSYWRNYYNRHA